MSELTLTTYQRQIADVTQDIRRKTGEFLLNAIEIGRLLFEAKSMVEPGGWSKYIEEELPFSHSWANNYMKLYTEFGSDQTSLFGDSQTFMKLTPTQALEVLRLPEEQREAFVESHDVEDMSTRQLRQAVQEQLDEERRLHDLTKEALATAEAAARDAEHSLLDMQQKLSNAMSDEGAWKEQIDKLTAQKHLAQTGESNAMKKVEVLENQLKDAQKKEKDIRALLKEAKENPEIPESMMEQLRREAEAEAVQKTAGDIQKQLEKANAELEAERIKAKIIGEKLEAVQRKSDPELVECNVMAQKLRADFNSLLGWVKKISAGDREKGEKMRKLLRLMVKAWAEALGMKVQEA